MSPLFFPFFKIQEVQWNILKAAERSLTVTEVASNAKVQPYVVSKVFKQIREGQGIKLAFETQLEKAGIINIAVISGKTLETLPYLSAARTLRVLGKKLYLYTGLLPAEDDAIEEWLSHFEESALVVRGLERAWWRTSASATLYSEGFVGGDINAIVVVKESNPPSLPSKETEFDEIDVLLLSIKYRWPFTSLREAERESERYLGRRVSHQELSRHFRNHVLKLWAGNRVWLYADAEQVPYKLLYLEGRDAPGVARALVTLPWFHTAYIDFDRAIVSGQPPCASMPHLYRALGDLDVDVMEFAMEVSLLKGVPLANLLRQLVKVRQEVRAE